MKMLLIAVVYFALGFGVCFLVQARPVEAAAPVPGCEAVAAAGSIVFYFCETDYGDFFANSVGFMIPAE